MIIYCSFKTKWLIHLKVNVRCGRNKRSGAARDMRVLSDKVVRESRLELSVTLQELNLLRRQFDAQSLDIIVQVLNLASSNDREDIDCFGANVGECNGCDGFDAVLCRDLGESFADLDFLWGLVATAHHAAKAFVVLLAFLHCLLRLELSATWSQGQHNL